jgi:hypothetical protein
MTTSTGCPGQRWIVASLCVPHGGWSTNSWLVVGREEFNCGGVGARMLIILESMSVCGIFNGEQNRITSHHDTNGACTKTLCQEPNNSVSYWNVKILGRGWLEGCAWRNRPSIPRCLGTMQPHAAGTLSISNSSIFWSSQAIMVLCVSSI